MRSPLFRYTLVALIILTIPVGLTMFSQKVKVRTGIRVVCKYGEVLEDNTKWTWVAKSEASKYGIQVRKMLCSRHREAEELYAKATTALRKKNFKLAAQTFSEVAAIDPRFMDVEQQLTKLGAKTPSSAKSGTTNGGGSSSPGGQKPSNNGGGTNGSGGNQSGNVFPGSLLAMLPTDVDGYEPYSQADSLLLASRDFRPDPNPLKKQLTMIVEYRGTSQDAARRLKELKIHFSVGAKSQTVEGRSTYFGIDNTQTAIVVWQSGGLVYEIQIASSSGSGKAYRSELLNLAARYF